MKKKPPPVYMCTHYTLKVPKKRSLASIISFPPPCAAISLHLRFTDHSPQPCASLLRLAHIVFFPIYLFYIFQGQKHTKSKPDGFNFQKVQRRLVVPTYFSFSVKFILKQYLEYMYKTFAKNLKGYGWFEQKKINKK